MQAHWGLKISSSVGGDDATRNLLANQLELLRALAGMPAGVTLTWRLESEAGDDVNPVSASLALYCSTDPGTMANDEELGELQNFASVGLAAGANFSLVRNYAPRKSRYRRYLLRDDPTSPLPFKMDWAILVDLLRHRGTDVQIEISCTSSGRDATVTRDGDVQSSATSAFDFDPGLAFLAALRPTSFGRSPGLVLTVSVSAPTPLNPVFLDIVGRAVLGGPTKPLTSSSYSRQPNPGIPPEVALRVWHAPYGRLQGRGLKARPPVIATPLDFSRVTGATLGKTQVQGPDWDRPSDLRISCEERLRHMYIVGKTGAGKTNLMKNVAEQDIAAGGGVAVITPHEDLIEHLILTSGARLDDIILLDFGDPEYVPILNPLTLDVQSPVEFVQNVSILTDLFAKRTFNQYTGPVFSDSVRLAFESVAELTPMTGEYPTLAAAVELIKSDKLQRWAARTVKRSRPDLGDEWDRLFNMRAQEVAETSRWVSAKFSDLGAHSALRSITTQVKPSPLSIKQILREGKVVLIRLPDSHMPPQTVSLLGAFLFNRMFTEAKVWGISDRDPFYVHVDEFQRFVTLDLEELVAEARKFRLGLTFAHQNLRQLEAFSIYEGASTPRLSEAIFSNVGTMITMKTAGRDAQRFADELSIAEKDIRSLTRGYAFVRTARDGEDITCSLEIPLARARSTPAKRRLRERMIRDGYWLPRDEQSQAAEILLDQLRSAADTLAAPAVKNAEPAKSGTSFLDDYLAKKQSSKLGPSALPNARADRGNVSASDGNDTI